MHDCHPILRRLRPEAYEFHAALTEEGKPVLKQNPLENGDSTL
jgi:hypothetical protein